MKTVWILVVACALAIAACAHAREFKVDHDDAYLDVPDLIAKYGYPVESHDVTTSDGYILQLHRIPHGRDNNNAPGARPVVFLMHGLLSSSADWIIMGPGQGLGYILAEEGFDVWMGNGRGNYYSRRNRSLNPNFGTGFWNFSWDQIGHIDIADSVDYVLANTGHDSLHYIGHSQGTTTFLVLCSLRPDYNSKFKTVHLMAPVAYITDLNNSLLSSLSDFSNSLSTIGTMLGLDELFPRGSTFEFVDGSPRCVQGNILSGICDQFFDFLANQNQDQFNIDMLPIVLMHMPAGSSLKQVAHYGQSVSDKQFRRWNYGSPLTNLLAYGRLNPPSYDLSAVTANVRLHYSLGDGLTPESDVLALHNILPQSSVRQIELDTFTHFDFAWGTVARHHVYDDVISSMNDHEKQN